MINGAIKELPNSEIEIEGSIGADIFSSYKEKALKSLNENSKMDGFRPGKIPEEILLKNLGEMAILEEMAEIALRELYPKFVIENKIEAIGRPSISLTKIAKDNPLEFKIKTAILPKFKIADYKKIAKEVWAGVSKEKIEATDKELEGVIDEIRKARAQKSAEHTCADENCKHEETPASDKKEDAVLPELTDEFVRSIGKFENVEDFKKKIKENIELEKTHAQKEKGRTQILDKVVEKTDISLPSVLVENEIDQVLNEVRGKIEQLGIKYEDYLAQIKKAPEELRKEADEPARKRVKYKLILKAIAKEEQIKIDQEELKKETDNLLKYYEGADPISTKMYVEDVMTNEKVFELLDNCK